MAMLHMGYRRWVNDTKNKLFGELYPHILESSHWEVRHVSGLDFRVRVATYYWARKKYPWYKLSKTAVGTQFQDDDCHPFNGPAEKAIESWVNLNLTIKSLNARFAERNQQRENHQNLRKALNIK